MHKNHDELLTIGPEALRARLAWRPGSAGVVVVIQPSNRLSRIGVTFLNLLRERRLSWLRLALLRRGERAVQTSAGQTCLLGKRVLEAVAWLRAQSYADRSRIGLFGEAQGAAIALWAASRQPSEIDALALCNARLDIGPEQLMRVRAATLVMAAQTEVQLLASTRRALGQFGGRTRLEVLPVQRRTVSDPESLELAARLAAGWFESQLGSVIRR